MAEGKIIERQIKTGVQAIKSLCLIKTIIPENGGTSGVLPAVNGKPKRYGPNC